jgi:hypothetical protein
MSKSKRIELEQFLDNLEEIVNPYKIIGSVSGSTAGMYGEKEWYRDVGFRIYALEEEKKNNLFAYLKETLPQVDETKGTQATTHVSHCVQGATAKAAIHCASLENGFFSALERTYATLEMLAHLVEQPKKSYEEISAETKSPDAKNALATALSAKGFTNDLTEEAITMFVTTHFCGSAQLNRLRMQYNKFVALEEHGMQGYTDAKKILEDCS